MNPIFLDNKYTRWYYAIVEKRAITDDRIRYETHHVIPRSLGGSDESENLVRLSGHDHAWCHWLLTKMTTGESRSKMIYAFNMMGVFGEHMERQSSYAIVRAYERNRLEWSKTHSETMSGREPWNKGLDMKNDARCKGGKKNKGKKRDPKASEQAASKHRGRKNTQETIEKMRVSQRGIPKPKSLEFREQVRMKLTGVSKPDGHGDKVAAAVIGNISINKDGKEKRVKDHQLQEYLDNGWSLGGRQRKKKVIT